MTIDLNKLEELNKARTQGEWVINESTDNIYAIVGKAKELVGDFDISFGDEAFVLELVNGASELLRLAKLGVASESHKNKKSTP